MMWAVGMAFIMFAGRGLIAFLAGLFLNSPSLITILLVPGALLIAILNAIPLLLPVVAGVATYMLLRDGKPLWYVAAAPFLWPLLAWELLTKSGDNTKKGYIVTREGETKRANGFPSEPIIKDLVRDPSGESGAGYFISSMFKRTFARTYKDNVDMATRVIRSENQFFDEHERHHTAGKEFLMRQMEKQQLTQEHIQEQLSYEQQRKELQRQAEIKRLRDDLGVPEAEAIETVDAQQTEVEKFKQNIAKTIALEEAKQQLMKQYPEYADLIKQHAEAAKYESVDDILRGEPHA